MIKYAYYFADGATFISDSPLSFEALKIFIDYHHGLNSIKKIFILKEEHHNA